MDPQFKKYLEIFIVIFLIISFVYFIMYKFHLDVYCAKMSQKVKNYDNMNLIILENCDSSLFCERTSELHEKWKLIEYSCSKKRYDKFELDYYTNLFK